MWIVILHDLKVSQPFSIMSITSSYFNITNSKFVFGLEIFSRKCRFLLCYNWKVSNQPCQFVYLVLSLEIVKCSKLHTYFEETNIFKLLEITILLNTRLFYFEKLLRLNGHNYLIIENFLEPLDLSIHLLMY